MELLLLLIYLLKEIADNTKLKHLKSSTGSAVFITWRTPIAKHLSLTFWVEVEDADAGASLDAEHNTSPIAYKS